MALRQCVEYASEFGIILAFETMETEFMNTIGKARQVVNKVNSPYLQVYPDIGNIYNATDDYLGDIKKGNGHIVAAHLKETVEDVFVIWNTDKGELILKHGIFQFRSQGVARFTCEFWYDKKTDPEEYITRNYRYIRGCFLEMGKKYSFGN